jgi:ATP-dependent helicase HepA
MHPFVPGQRWLSETQGDLGLGLVTGVDERCVQIAFPATGETRLYALRNAPLARAEIDPGERIRDRAGHELTVVGRDEVSGLITYHCEDIDGAHCTLREVELDDHLHLNRPRQRLLAGRIDPDLWFTLRYEAWLQGMAEADSPVLGLVGARIGLIPHQIYIAAEVAGRYAPRVLLADEVGLGKTIEAGLILHRLLLTGRAERVLILVPEPLLHQWLVELRRRFNLPLALFDRDRLAAMDGGQIGGARPESLLHSGHVPPPSGPLASPDKAATDDGQGNPFHAEQRVLCSLDLLTGDPAAARAALAGNWDLLVVDEAHHLAWAPPAIPCTQPETSLAYDLVADLAAHTPGVLLLTATPEQLGRAGHFGRLRLLDPERFHDYAAFLDEEHRYAPVAELASRLLAGEAPGEADRALLDPLMGDCTGLAPAQILERLLDRHGTGRVLFRNTRAAIPGFPGRVPNGHPLPLPAAYTDLATDGAALLTPEAAYGHGWTEVDPRIDWLIATLRALRPAKVLLICARAQTVLDLREALMRRAGIHAAVFHEGMEIVERDRAAAYFAAVEDGTQVLLCSEIGSEGRNFQFAHHLILFDLPLEPDLLEQRIGRLDRIGQRETIRIEAPYFTGSPCEALYRWYSEGLGALGAVCHGAAAVYAELREDLYATVADPSRCNALVARAAARSAEVNAELAAGRDRLLELHSHRPEVSASLVDMIEAQDAGRSVGDWICRLWDAFGIDSEPGPGGALVVRPGPHMLHEGFPGLPEDGLTATFDRAAALAHEDREFLTWEHPMVRGAMELVTHSDLGSSALTLLRDRRFKPATLLLEAVYIAECPAPPALGIARFLPPTALRLVIDAQGRDLADTLPHAKLRGDCLTRNRKLVSAIVKSQAERLGIMLGHAETLARDAAIRLQGDAKTRMRALLGEELDRLRALAAVNPNVRREELAYLDGLGDLIARHLERASLRLDALRLIVTG